MRSRSEAALTRVASTWEALLHDGQGNPIEMGWEVFSVADVVRSNSAVLSALEDASRDIDDRLNLVNDIFAKKISAQVLELLHGLVRERWAEKGDLLKALENLGVQTILIGAEKEGLLSKTEEELYQSLRLLKRERTLRVALQDSTYPASARTDLMRRVFGNLNPYTQALLARSVSGAEKNTLSRLITDYIVIASERGKHLVAAVTSAIPLTSEQEERLRLILSNFYKKDVKLHIALDPAVIGGLRIHIGDDVIDGTLASRIADVKAVFSK
ncbi:F0F1 ATP synthase subunit delta [Arcanobacterium ihumii]|uniref:F0F1 ATP synthase subunit delta n=1 Tax=Arcanobacterium ihumii TaxID=2138162 RepID=UPI000F530900|nr:F0F1 ATP synthase subunit delta [Arcanobacterium ihumii]